MNQEQSISEQQHETAPEWAVVELMGHVKMAGRISEETKFGVIMGRLDVPKGDAFVTTYFSGASVYRVTPCDEKSARDVAEYGYVRRPVAALQSPMDDEDYDPNEGDDYDDENPFADNTPEESPDAEMSL